MKIKWVNKMFLEILFSSTLSYCSHFDMRRSIIAAVGSYLRFSRKVSVSLCSGCWLSPSPSPPIFMHLSKIWQNCMPVGFVRGGCGDFRQWWKYPCSKDTVNNTCWLFPFLSLLFILEILTNIFKILVTVRASSVPDKQIWFLHIFKT